MKTPRFEELAQRWQGKAEVFIVYSREAHADGSGAERLEGFADRMLTMDADKDGRVTLAEAGPVPRFMFDAFDVDGDGIIYSHEFLTARRVKDFRGLAAPATYDDRVKLAQAFRREVPGSIPMLIDEMDNRVATAYGGLPNSAFVIDGAGVVRRSLGWASVAEIERTLTTLAGGGAPPAPGASVAKEAEATALDATTRKVVGDALAAAARKRRPLLVSFTARGCAACQTMASTTLVAPAVGKALGRFERTELAIERDEAWAAFEALDLSATPAFVIVEPDGRIRARSQGLRDEAAFLTFLGSGKRRK